MSLRTQGRKTQCTNRTAVVLDGRPPQDYGMCGVKVHEVAKRKVRHRRARWENPFVSAIARKIDVSKIAPADILFGNLRLELKVFSGKATALQSSPDHYTEIVLSGYLEKLIRMCQKRLRE